MKRISAFTILFILVFAVSGQAATVTLAWDASSGATGYKLYYGTATKNYTTTIDVKNVLTYTIPNLPDGSTYYFAATAYDASSESDYSTEVSYMALMFVKNVRRAVAIATTPAAELIAWDAVTGSTGYKVKYGTTSGTYPTVIDAKAVTAYLVTGLKNNTTYYLVVTAYGADGKETDNSAELSFKTLAVSGLTVR